MDSCKEESPGTDDGTMSQVWYYSVREWSFNFVIMTAKITLQPTCICTCTI